MRIALVSYEYPLDSPLGGISTYTYQAALLLSSRGHEVEVFAGSLARDVEVESEGIRVHLVQEASRYDFAIRVAYCFERRHKAKPFDVVETPELYAESRKILELFPAIPLVVRLHTPNLMLWKLSVQPRSPREIIYDLVSQARNLSWHLRRGYKLPDIRLVRHEISHAQYCDIIENDCAKKADRVVALFPGMRDFATSIWHIPKDRVVVSPNPYSPSPALLSIPHDTFTNTISFIGRLEVRKGILSWLKAIPLIARKCPAARFRFVGRSSSLPDGRSMASYLKDKLHEFSDRLEFTGEVPPEQMPDQYAQTGIVVAPSLWENYPYACLEAMASGRAVVGSNLGGMALMLAEGSGILINPRNPRQLAKEVIFLLENPDHQKILGERARAKVCIDHNADCIGSQMEAVYLSAIQERRQSGPRAA